MLRLRGPSRAGRTCQTEWFGLGSALGKLEVSSGRRKERRRFLESVGRERQSLYQRCFWLKPQGACLDRWDHEVLAVRRRFFVGERNPVSGRGDAKSAQALCRDLGRVEGL